MKYTLEIEIDLPRDKVAEIFADPESIPKWQPGFISMEHISGEKGQAGSKTKLLYNMGRRETEMVETITANRLPDEFHGTYEANGVLNIQENIFEEIGPNKTKWTSVTEFQFSNFGMKLIGWLMPGAFKKQSYKFMEYFKKFAETGEAAT